MEISIYLQTTLLVVTVAVNLILAAIVYSNNPHSATNRVYTLLSIVISVWLAANYISLLPMEASASLVWIRLSIFFATPMLVLLVLFAHTLPSSQFGIGRKPTIMLVVVSALVMAVCLSPYAFTSVAIHAGDPQPEVGPGIGIFGLTALICLGETIRVLLTKLRRSAGATREMFRYVMLGIVVMLVFLLTAVLVPAAVFKSSFGVQFIPVYVSMFLLATTYAIVRHRLFDLRVLVTRAASYLLLLTTLSGIYVGALYVVLAWFVPGLDMKPMQTATFMVLALITAFTLPPLRRFFERATDKFFFRDRYDSQAMLDRISSIFATELELRPLMTKFLKETTSTMRLTSAQLIVLEQNKIYGQQVQGKMALLSADALSHLRHPLIVADQLPSGALRHFMTELNVQVALQLRAHGELVGYLVLGDKKSGSVYSMDDLAVLEIMRKELAVAVANAKAYDEIAQFNATLQERIRVATRRLKSANKNLRALDKTKDEFISMASHQLGTPLTAITGYLSMALQNDNKNMTDDQKEFVSYALEAAEKMVYMSGDMLNVSRLNSGRFMIQRQPTELTRMITQELHQLDPTAARKGLKLTHELPNHPVTATLDESKTRQVIMNFIDNALYYTQEGGVHVKLVDEPGKITFTVTDTGIGVPKAVQGKLFAKFYRADNAKSVRPDGTGLGLYLAKRVIEDQGGRILFASEEGKGSTFGFVLPV